MVKMVSVSTRMRAFVRHMNKWCCAVLATVGLSSASWAGSFRVIYDANGGTGTMSDQWFTGDNNSLELSLNRFTKAGYTFVGWSRHPNEEPRYADGAVVTRKSLSITKPREPSAEQTLYAAWGKEMIGSGPDSIIEKLYPDVEFYTGGEDGYWGEESLTALRSYGKYCWIAAKVKGPGSFSCSILATDVEDLRGDLTSFVGGGMGYDGLVVHSLGAALISEAREYNKTIQLPTDKACVIGLGGNYSRQGEYMRLFNISMTYTVDVAFDANGGVIYENSRQYDVGAKYGEFPVATKRNDTFIGWFSDPVGGTQITTSSIVEKSITKLYAHWQNSTPTVTLAAPTGVTASDGTVSGGVRVNWNAVSGAASYEVFRAGSSSGTKQSLGTTSTISFTDSSAQSGITYWYFVKAKDSSGNTSDFSTGNSGYAKAGSSGNQPPAWTPVAKEDTMVVYATVTDRRTKTAVAADGSLLAAFDARGECRGKTEIMDGPRGRLYSLSIGVESATEKGFVLKVWDSSTGETVEIGERVNCNSEKQLGTIGSPYEFVIGAVEQTVCIRQGWNWISTCVAPEDSSVGAVFSGCSFADDDVVKSVDSTATYYGGAWYPNTFTIKPGAAYVVRKSTSGESSIVVSGEQMSDGFAVKSGWNWIGSTKADEVAIAGVSHSGGFADDDMVKDVRSQTTYYGGSWYPASFVLNPGMGYKVKLAKAGTMTFGNNILSRLSVEMLKPMLETEPKPLWAALGRPSWEPVPQEDTMVVYARIVDGAGTAIESDGSVLAAFSSSGECRGVAEVIEGPNGKLFSLSVGVASSTESGFTLKIWDAQTQSVREIEGTFANNSEGVIGKIYAPVVKTVKNSTPPTPTTCIVTYNPGAYGVGAVATDKKTPGVALTLKGVTFTRTGYTQTGWSKNASGSTKDYNLSASYTTDAAVTLYPYWTANTYSITYALNGGTHGSTHPPSAKYDTAFYVSAPTRSGYTFAGWTVTSGLNTSTAKWGTSSSPSTSVSSSTTKCVNGASGNVYFKNLTPTAGGGVTLTANWAVNPVTSCTVTYNPGAYGVGAVATDKKTPGVALALKGAIFTRRDDFSQAGWSLAPDGTTYDFALGELYDADAPITLYPFWSFGVWHFDANGGTGTMLDAPMDPPWLFPPNGFVREGYEFLGWSLDSRAKVPDAPDGAAPDPMTLSGKVTIYAVWRKTGGGEPSDPGETDPTVRTAEANGYTWSYRVTQGKAEILGGWYETLVTPEPAGSVVIPEKLGGYVVGFIGDCAFTRCSRLTEVTIPACVVNIGTAAFQSCDRLSSVAIPASVTNVGYRAFAFCGAITTVAIGAGVATIGDWAFAGCSEVVSYCVDVGNRVYSSPNGMLCSRDGKLLICGVTGDVDIPADVTTIANWAFWGCHGMSTIDIPADVTDIGESAFLNYGGATLVKIPASVTNIGVQAFAACYSLMAYEVDGWNDFFDSTDGMLLDRARTLVVSCPGGRKSVEIPSSVMRIGEWAFSGCQSLASVPLPSGLKQIGENAFNGCYALTSVGIPASVEVIEREAFYACSQLRTVEVAKGDAARVSALLAASGFDVSRLTFVEKAETSCTVTYNPGSYGVGAVATDKKTPGVALTLKGAIFTRRDDFSQAGWSLDPDGTTYDFALGESYDADAPITLYPFWSFGVWHFDANGGTGTMLDAPMDPPWLFPPNGFVREGYEFLGWSLNSRAKVPDAPDGAAPDPMTLSGKVTIYAVWRKIPSGNVDPACLWSADEDVDLAAANTYNAFVWNGECVVGYAQVKTAKGSRNKTTGMTTATVTATVTDAAGKKWSYSKGKVGADGAVSGLVCSSKGAASLVVSVGANGVIGSWGEYVVSGARNGFSVKGSDAAAALAAHFQRSWTLVLGTADAAAPTYVQLNIKAKGAVAVAGKLPDGTKVSASTQLILDEDGNGWVPVSVVLKKVGSLRFLVRLDAEAQTAELVGDCRWTLSDGKAVTGEAEFRLDEGGATVPPVQEGAGYEPSVNNMVGVNFAAQVLVNGLGYPAKFSAKGLPKGLKIDAATGAITGVPTKAGSFPVTVTVAGTANSKWAKAVIPFAVEIAQLPAWAQGAFTGYATDANDGAELFGAASLSVSAAGKVSGKATVAGTAWSFAATGYAADSAAADGVLRIAATAKKGKLTRELSLEVTALASPDDQALLANGRAAGAFGEGRMAFWRTVWSDKATKDAAKRLAADWKGVYAVRLPARGEAFAGGWGYLSLAVSDGGSVKATGKLADGTAVSLTAPLCFGSGREAFVVLCASPSAYKGGSIFLPLGFAADLSVAELSNFDTLWTSLNPQATGDYTAGGFRTDFSGVKGAWHDKLEALRDRYASLTFALDKAPELGYAYKCTDYNDSGRKTTETWQEFASAADTFGQSGNTVTFDAKGKLIVAKKTNPVKDKESGEYIYAGVNDGALTLSYNAATGVFKGSYTLWYDYESAFDGTKGKSTFAHKSKKINFEGIVVEGLEPSGFYLWSQSAGYTDAKGKAKTYTWKESYPVRLDSEE